MNNLDFKPIRVDTVRLLGIVGSTKRCTSYNLYRIFCTIFLGPSNHRHIVNHRREALDSAASYTKPKTYAEFPAVVY
jgi:hypothetical protein